MKVPKDLADMITGAILAHGLVHEGEFMQCEDEDCTEIRLDLMALIDLEATLQPIRAARP